MFLRDIEPISSVFVTKIFGINNDQKVEGAGTSLLFSIIDNNIVFIIYKFKKSYRSLF